MFVKPKASFQKLLDKKPLRTAAYGDSKGFGFFKKLKFLMEDPVISQNPLFPCKSLHWGTQALILP